VRPDDQSVAVHYLKSPAEAPWQIAHNASRDVEATAFPPPLWSFGNPRLGVGSQTTFTSATPALQAPPPAPPRGRAAAAAASTASTFAARPPLATHAACPWPPSPPGAASPSGSARRST
jgi:hypothetical protein